MNNTKIIYSSNPKFNGKLQIDVAKELCKITGCTLEKEYKTLSQMGCKRYLYKYKGHKFSNYDVFNNNSLIENKVISSRELARLYFDSKLLPGERYARNN